MDEDRQTQTKISDAEYYDDEIELMDYLLVIWKWKYVIIAGTLAFMLVAAIISVTVLKHQPTMYRTRIVLKPGILKIDKKGSKVFDTPENVRALIENDLKYKVLEQIKDSNNSKLSTALNFQANIQKGSNTLSVSLDSASADESVVKLNYLIKTLMLDNAVKINQIKNNIDKLIMQKKDEFHELSFKINLIKAKINKYEEEISDIVAKIKLLKDSKDLSQSKEYLLSKLSLENDYRNTFQIYFEGNENAKINLFESEQIINKLSNEIEKLEKEKQKIQGVQIIKPPVTTELPKTNKTKRNVIFSSAVGFFIMLFLSFFFEYLSNYKKRQMPHKN